MKYKFEDSFYKADEDECTVASETYKCGKEKEPVIMEKMINTTRGTDTAGVNLKPNDTSIKLIFIK
jgi:hypothetical protein